MACRIVVGINGSSADTGAVKWAANYATREQGELHLVSVLDSSRGGKQLGKQAEELLANHAAAVKEYAPDLTVTTELHHCDSLPHGFEEVSADATLLVIGRDADSHRSPATVRIAAVSKAPVVAIPEVDVTDRTGIVVGADGSDVSRKALEFGAAEAKASGEPLYAVMSWQVNGGLGYEFAITEDFLHDWEDDCQSELDESIADVEKKFPDVEIKREVVQGYPAEALAERAKTARLLVVGTHGRGAFGRLLLGSVSHELLQDATVPTVVVR